MTKDEALKLALEALKQIDEAMPFPVAKLAQAIIKEVLAQPEQEPVAWQFMKGSNFRKHRPDDFDDLASDGLPYWKPLYTTPPQRKPLTDKQILADETLRYYFGLNGGAGPVSKQGRKIVNAIEALHNIKE